MEQHNTPQVNSKEVNPKEVNPKEIEKQALEIFIDNRETKLVEFFQNKDYVKVVPLDLGDIVFKYNGELILLVERKTLADLASSIKDGRYKEQKCRLLMTTSKDKILYLIEGDLNKSGNTIIAGLTVYTLFSSIMNMLLRDNIKIYKSQSIHETIRFIKKMAKKFKKQGTDFLQHQTLSYGETLKTKKKDNLTPPICFRYQLSQIPGVSYKIASCVATIYPNLFDLVKCYLTHTPEKCINMLADIKMQLNNGKTRRIGKKASTNIYTYLSGG